MSVTTTTSTKIVSSHCVPITSIRNVLFFWKTFVSAISVSEVTALNNVNNFLNEITTPNSNVATVSIKLECPMEDIKMLATHEKFVSAYKNSQYSSLLEFSKNIILYFCK